MGGIPAGLNGAVLVAGHVHDHGTGLHQLQVLTIDNVILAVLGPQDAVDDDVGLPQALLQIGAVGDHVGDVGGGGLLGGQHGVHVDIQNTHLVAEGGSQLGSAGTHHAAAQHGDDGGLHAGDVGQQLAGAAVDGLGKVQGRQEAALTGQLTHGAQQGELTLLVLHILIGHGGDVAVQQGVRLVGVSVGVDVGEEDLVLVHPLELLGEQLLDLVVQVGFLPDGVGVGDDSAGSLILRIAETAAYAGAGFHVHGVTVTHDLMHGGGYGRHTVFITLDFLQYSNDHFCYLTFKNKATKSITVKQMQII